MPLIELLANVRREGAPANGIFFLLCVGLGLLAAACGRSVAGGGERSGESSVVLLREDQLESALLAGDPGLKTFISDLEAAIAAGDSAVLRRSVDHAALIRLIMEGTPESKRLEPVRRGFMEGTLNAWKKSSPLERFTGAHYQFLRARIIAGRPGLVFRSSDGDGELNYHLHSMVRGADGRYRIADTFVVGVGESIADTLRRGFIHLAADADPESVPGEDIEASSAFVANLDAIGKLSEAVSSKRFADALDMYHALPASVQKVRDVLLMRVEAAARVSPLMLDEALDLWKQEFDDESLLALKFIDYYMARGNFERARELAWDIELMTGGDPYLRVRIGELSFAVRNQMPSMKLGGPEGRARRGQAQGR